MSNTLRNRQWLLAKRPQGMVSIDHFRRADSPLPIPQYDKGEVLVRNIMLSFDPAQRGWMEDVPSYLPPVAIGEVMRASSIAEVVQSTNAALPVGARVQGLFGWQDYAVAPADSTLIPEEISPEQRLGVLGGASLTAWAGLFRIGQLKTSDTVVISAAAGAVGSIAVQIAKLHGARVIGIAGGPEKCDWVVNSYGADAAIDYKSENLSTRLSTLCPEGVSLFFDNVGGDTLETMIAHMAPFGRIVMCGAISRYNDKLPQAGPHNMINIITRRLRLEGFILLDHLDCAEEAMVQLSQWLLAGKLHYRTDVQHGFDNIPATFLRLFNSQSQGKQLLTID